MDVKTTFLHVDLEEEIYMKQPEAFSVKGKKELVCKLKKSLYGLKQSPRMWYQKFDTFIRGLGFTRSKADHCVYFKLIGDHVIYLVLYVDYMLLVGNNKEIIEDLKTQLSSKFDMKDLGSTNYILGMEIKRDRAKRKLWLNQRKYFETILQRFMSKPGKEHWTAVKRVFRLGWISRSEKTTSGYVFNLFGGAVSWMSKKQFVVALTTTEGEYMVATHASKEVVWLQTFCSSMGLVQGAIRIDCDSQSAIFLAKNPAYHSKTKHIDVQYHFVRDMIEDKKVLLVKVDTLKNTADALTNLLALRSSLGVEKQWVFQGWKND
eukprot:PITA_03016